MSPDFYFIIILINSMELFFQILEPAEAFSSLDEFLRTGECGLCDMVQTMGVFT